MPRSTPRKTLVLLDANVFIDVAQNEVAGQGNPVLKKLARQHTLIYSSVLEKHYTGAIYNRLGESAIRYIDSVCDLVRTEEIHEKEFNNRKIRLSAKQRPIHRADSFLVKIAIVAGRRGSNRVVIVSNNDHIYKLDPILRTDFDIRALDQQGYLTEFCSPAD